MSTAHYIHCLASPRMRTRQGAVRRLVRIGSDAVPTLMEAAASRSKEARMCAAEALARIGDSRGFDAIAAQLDDPDDFVQYEAAWALGIFKDERAVGPLIERLRRDDDSGASNGARQWMDMFGQAAVEPLLQVLRDGSPGARVSAAHNLASIGDERAFDPIAALAEATREMDRVWALEALGRLGREHPERFGERCIALIAKYADDAHEDVRGAVEGETESIREAIEELTAVENKPPRSRQIKLLLSEKRHWDRSRLDGRHIGLCRRRRERLGLSYKGIKPGWMAGHTWWDVVAMRARDLEDY